MDTFTSMTAGVEQAEPLHDTARGLLSDCDLRWMGTIGLLAVWLLWLIAVR